MTGADWYEHELASRFCDLKRNLRARLFPSVFGILSALVLNEVTGGTVALSGYTGTCRERQMATWRNISRASSSREVA
jgi:hypothetical protein